nr:hypothetical protein [Tanacetum cinerariifolium]
RGHRKKETSVHLRDYVTNIVKKKSPSRSTPPAQSRSSGTPYPIAHYVNCDKFSSCHRAFLEAIETEREHVTYHEAIKDKRWRSTMDSELEALEHETIERFKARLIILGNHQVEGIDYNETFAPVAKMVTVCVFLAVAASKQWELHQMDVHTAFLHGDLEEEVFIKLPPGLNKDYSLFALSQNEVQLNVRMYVDDLIISVNDSKAITQFKTYLSDCFHMKDLGTLKYFLGVEVARAQDEIFLCQGKYALNIICEAVLLGASKDSNGAKSSLGTG